MNSTRCVHPTANATWCFIIPIIDTSLPQLPVDHMVKLVRLWRSRFLELKATPGIRYVLIFENKGAVIGVTMPHPHGQIYSFPFIPPRVRKSWRRRAPTSANTGAACTATF